MKRNSLLAASLLLGLASPVLAAPPSGAGKPACQLRIDTGASTWVIRNFDLFGNSSPSATFELTFTNVGSNDCQFRPVFALDHGPFGLRAETGKPVPYSLFDQFAATDVTPRSGAGNPRLTSPIINLASNSQQVVRYQFLVDEDSIPGDGLFSQTVTVEAQGADGRAFGSRELVLGVDVLPSATLGLAGSYTSRDGMILVDLGELDPGQVAIPLQLRVQSTGRYTLGVESLNSGRLRLGASDWYVPYQLRLGGQDAVLSSGRTELASPSGSGLTRAALPIHVVVGETSGRRAGTYSDVVSISVAAQ